MDSETATLIIDKLIDMDVRDVEFTGGTPEMNPNLSVFIERLSKAEKNLTVRTSLTVLDMPKYRKYLDLYMRHRVRVVASLPGLFPDVTDAQRGRGVFRKTIKILKRLNQMGFGSNGLCLDLVYNPLDAQLPPDQSQLEEEYRRFLKKNHGIEFNNLVCIANSPIRRFRKALEKRGILRDYLEILKSEFNPETLDVLMCRDLISVDYKGHVYDCDFNLATNLRIRGYEDKRFWEIDFDSFTPEIPLHEHCYACTVGRGSSCEGELVKDNSVRETVKLYYGSQLSSTTDLKTSACCSTDSLPSYVKDVLPYIVDEIKERFYGCGSPIPPAIEGCTILDLGCGTGRDVYVASKLVGHEGYVIGVDMTDEQLEVARRNIQTHIERFGYKRPNVDFRKGFIEDLKAIGIEDNSVDVVISNCVINLSPDKEAVFREIFRVLKPGGELYFSDVFSGRRVPEHLRNDPVLLGECLSGAMYIEDFRRLLRHLGCLDYRVVSKKRISLDNPEIEEKIGMVDFYSITIRAFKLDDLEDICEDYGQVAVYKGTIPGFPHFFELDDHHRFITGKPMLVCGNTASMLQNTRYAPHFQVMGDRSTHYGPFNCAPSVEKPVDEEDTLSGGACC
jgi:radical SAM/Cys-rich protein